MDMYNSGISTLKINNQNRTYQFCVTAIAFTIIEYIDVLLHTSI